ncbi:MAG: hypothetical protein WC897_01965 [Candidatus Gracilibacteria bacterium]
MKQAIIISALFTLLLSGCTTNTTTEISTPKVSPNQEETTQAGSFLVECDGISFQSAFDSPCMLNETPFTSFDTFADDLENNLIENLIQANKQNQLTDSQVESELQKYTGRYSFERKEINGFNVVIHQRDFFGIIGDVYEAYIYIGDGKYIVISDEFNHDNVDKALSTLSK